MARSSVKLILGMDCVCVRVCMYVCTCLCPSTVKCILYEQMANRINKFHQKNHFIFKPNLVELFNPINYKER